MKNNGNTKCYAQPRFNLQRQAFTIMILFGLCLSVPSFSNTPQWNWDLSFDSLLKLTSGISSKIDYRKYLNLKQTPEDDILTVQQYSFGSLNSDHNHLSVSSFMSSNQIETQNIKPEVIRKPLVYPNPFRQEDGGMINYHLSVDMDVSIQIYDMAGNRIYSEERLAGALGAKEGNNNVVLDNSTFDGFNLSAGVYFIYLIHKDKVLSKGKLAVVP